MKKNKKKKIVLFAAVFLSLIFMISFSSCTLLGGSRTAASSASTAGTQTFTVKKGNITQSVATTGYVDTSETNSYSNQVAGDVLGVLSVGTKFNKGDVILKIDDKKTPLLISQAQLSVDEAVASIKTAQENY